MISIDKKLWNLLSDAPTANILKIFLFIALNQPDEGIHGLRTTKIQLAIDLNLKIRTIFDALKWLEDNLLVQELKMAEDFDFMVNPHFVMNNSNFDERKEEWNRRCRLDIQREIRLKSDRRIRQCRLEKKQKN